MEQLQQKRDSSIAEEEEEEGVKDRRGNDGTGVEGVDGEPQKDGLLQEFRRQIYGDTSNWTKSLDRRSPLSPQRNGETRESSADSRTDGDSFQSAADRTQSQTEPMLCRERCLTGESESPLLPARENNYGSEGGKSSTSEGMVVKKKPPLPPGVREARKEKEQQAKQQQQQQQQQQEEDGADKGDVASPRLPVKVVIEGAERSVEATDHTDRGARRYIAQMRARGHKRASSAPTNYIPTPTANVPPAMHIESDRQEEEEMGRKGRVKVRL